MRLPMYQNQGQVGAPAVDISNVNYNNSGEQALAGANTAMTKTLAVGAEQLGKQIQVSQVLQFNNELNAAKNKILSEVYQNKESNAQNSVEDFSNKYQKEYDKLKSKYGQYLYGDAGNASKNMATKDYNTALQAVTNYQFEETEKWHDTEMNNSNQESASMMAGNYKDDQIFKNGLDKISQVTAARYFNYGADRIKLETQKQQAAAVAGGITTAINNNDWTGANSLIVKYGDYIPKDKLSSYAKLVNAQVKAETQAASFDGLYKQYGPNDDEQGFLKAYMEYYANNNKGGYNAVAAVAKARASLGQQRGVNNCTTSVNEWTGAGGASGGNLDATERMAEAKKGQRWYDADKIGSIQNGDVVFWDTHEDGQAWHTGVYDAEKGQVIESGTHGVAYLNLHDYKLLGFERPQGSGPATISPADMQKAKDEAHAFWMKNKGIETHIANAIIDKGQDELTRAVFSGGATESGIRSMAAKLCLNSDGTVNSIAARKLGLMADRICAGIQREQIAAARRSGGGTGTGGSGRGEPVDKDPFAKVNLMVALNDGEMSTDQAEEQILSNVGNYSAENRKAMYNAVQDFKNGKSWHINDYKQEIMSGYNATDTGVAWRETERSVAKWYEDYTRVNGHNPSSSEVVSAGQKFLTDGISYTTPGRLWGTNTGTLTGVEAAQHGLYSVSPAGDGSLWFKDDKGRSHNISGAQYQRIKNGESWQDVVDD